MLTIYAIPVSLYCAKLRILLRRKGLEWEEVLPPGGYGSDAYKTVVPSGNLPALVHEGMTLGDSEAIAEYLEERFPEPSLLPGDAAARAKARERGRFHDTRLEPALRAVFPYMPGRPAAPEGFLEYQSTELSARLAQLAALLADTPSAGESLTLGDCGYPITFAWLEALAPPMGLAIDWPEGVSAYRRRIEALPAVAAELADYMPKLRAFLARPVHDE